MNGDWYGSTSGWASCSRASSCRSSQVRLVLEDLNVQGLGLGCENEVLLWLGGLLIRAGPPTRSSRDRDPRPLQLDSNEVLLVLTGSSLNIFDQTNTRLRREGG